MSDKPMEKHSRVIVSFVAVGLTLLIIGGIGIGAANDVESFKFVHAFTGMVVGGAITLLTAIALAIAMAE